MTNASQRQIIDFQTVASIVDTLNFAAQLAAGGRNKKIPWSQLRSELLASSAFNTAADTRADGRINARKNIANGVMGLDASLRGRIANNDYFFTDTTSDSYLGGPSSNVGSDICLNAKAAGSLAAGDFGSENICLDWDSTAVATRIPFVQKFPTSAFADEFFANGQGQFWINESTNRISAKIVKSGGSILNFTGLLSLADANIANGYAGLDANKMIYANAEGSGIAVDAVTTPRFAWMKPMNLYGVISRVNGQSFAIGRTSDSDVRNTVGGNFTHDLIADGSGYIIQPLQASAIADGSLSNRQASFSAPSDVPTLKYKTSAGAVVSYPLTAGGILDSHLLNMGSAIDATIRGNFSITGGESVIVHYDSGATSSSRIYAWANASGGYQLQRRNDDASNSSGIFTVLPNSSTLGDMNIYIGGKKFYVPNQIAIGNGGISITDTILGVSGVHSVFNYTPATSGGRIYDWFLNASGELNLNRINDAGDTVTDTALKVTPIDASTSRLNVSGTIVAASSVSAGSALIGKQLLITDSSTSTFAGIANTSAASKLKQWAWEAGNTGNLTINGYDDGITAGSMAINITRVAGGGSGPTITGVFKFDNAASWDVTSDRKFKKADTIKSVSFDKSTEVMSKINVRNFQYTEDFCKPKKHGDKEIHSSLNHEDIQIGFIAQELEEACQEAVTKNEDGDLQYKLDPILYHMMNSHQDLIKRIEKLETLH